MNQGNLQRDIYMSARTIIHSSASIQHGRVDLFLPVADVGVDFRAADVSEGAIGQHEEAVLGVASVVWFTRSPCHRHAR